MALDLLVVVKRINVIVFVCDALFGKKHHLSLRMVVGVGVMAVGVGIAKGTGHLEPLPLAVLGDMVGYAVHGLGLTPFLEKLLSMFEQE